MFKNVMLYAIFALLAACAPGKYALEEQNDYFTFFNKDSDYTQGLRLSHANDEREIAIGQRVYTPVHKKVADPLPSERPYAGYTYLSYQMADAIDATSTLRWGLEPGLVGPHAYGEDVQCEFHKAIGQACPAGWHNQLHDEPVLTLRVTADSLTPSEFLFTKGAFYNFTTIEVGNLSDAIHVGSQVQYYVTPWFRLYAGPQLHLVARNLLLDGNTFRDSLSVDKNWHYEQMDGGFEFKLGGASVKWILSVVSPQFEEQGTSYNYGGVTISWEN